MKKKQMIGVIALSIAGGVGILAFIIYATVKTKSTNISKFEPYNEWVGQTVTLDRPAILFQENIPMVDNNDYPYILLDSLHPKWLYIDEQKQIGNLQEIIQFAEGTRLNLENAIQYTNGVSGSSYPMIFGTITAHGKSYKIGYQWGTLDIGKRMNKVEKCWQFHQAPWQANVDMNFYALPTANFW